MDQFGESSIQETSTKETYFNEKTNKPPSKKPLSKKPQRKKPQRKKQTSIQEIMSIEINYAHESTVYQTARVDKITPQILVALCVYSNPTPELTKWLWKQCTTDQRNEWVSVFKWATYFVKTGSKVFYIYTNIKKSASPRQERLGISWMPMLEVNSKVPIPLSISEHLE